MKRRNCLLSLSGTVLLSHLAACTKKPAASKTTKFDSEILKRVKRAMLSMQRASWEQGVAVQAFLESGNDELVYLMAKEAVLRQTNEGRLSVLYTDNGVTDPAASGEAVLYAAHKWNDSEMKEAADQMLMYLLEKAPRTDEGIISHTLNAKEIWIDSMYMSPPFLAAAGQYEEAMKQIDGIHSVLWNGSKKLYSHIWSVEKNAFKNEKCWGVGNGWALTGMTRVAGILPKAMEQQKALLIQRIKTTLDSCLSRLRYDYLFHNIIDDSSSFIETNLSQMIAYTIFRGVSENWLNTDYLDIALKLRNTAYKKVDVYGFVQGVCGAPYFNRPGRATEGQAFFILMEAAYQHVTASVN
jgi:unsaturated rhamnogalacturonyl hydrolase